jgi:hypothetical protein
MMPMRANIVGPPDVATRIKASMAALPLLGLVLGLRKLRDVIAGNLSAAHLGLGYDPSPPRAHDRAPRNEVRPTRIERRARLVNAIAQGRRWLDEIVSGSAANIEQIATRQKCSVRQVNMTISLALYSGPWAIRNSLPPTLRVVVVDPQRLSLCE